jgi:hypothetical protein
VLRRSNPNSNASVDRFQYRRSDLRLTCLLCQVLWPTILPHRHLRPDDFSEARTLLVTKEAFRPLARG